MAVPVTITERGAPVTLVGGDIPAGSIPFGSPGDPAGPLGPDGKIPSSQLPPLEHDIARAATQAEMLALAVTTPAICIRTDFTPPHMFYLVADPASTLANWEDTGEFGASTANPSVTVGLTAKNGTADTIMRSDAAPALDQSIVPTWTGKHTFTNSGGTAFTNAIAQTLVVTNTGTTGPTAIISTASSAGSGISTLRVQSTHASAGASLAFHSTALGTDLKTWDIYQGGTTLSFRTSDDANSTNATWLTATRAGNTIAGITSDSGSGQWGHTGNFSASGAVAGNTTVTAGIGSNSVQMVGAASGQDVKIRALGVTDANVSIELSAKGTGLLKMGSPTTVAGALTVAGQVSAAQGAGSASPTNSGIALATAPNWSMAQFYDSARTANNRSMDILFIGDGLHMRFANDARNAFLDFLTVTGGQALGVTGITSTSGSGAWAHTGAFSVSGNLTVNGNATFGANEVVAGTLGVSGGGNLPSPTNSGISLHGAPALSVANFYTQSATQNNRTAQIAWEDHHFKIRLLNDIGSQVLEPFTIAGGQGDGIAFIASNSGTGAWAHTGQFSVTTGGTPRFIVTAAGDLQAAANYIPATPDSLVTVSSVPLRVSADGKTSQAANVNVPALYAVPTSGLYRVSSYIVISQAATTSSTMPSVTVEYTDATIGAALSELMTNTSNANTVGTHLGGSAVISAQQGTNIGYVTAGYASSGATPMQYAVHMKIEFLG